MVIKIAVRGGYYQGLGHGTNLAAAGCPCVSFLHDVKIYHNLIAAGGGRSGPVDRGWWCADCTALPLLGWKMVTRMLLLKSLFQALKRKAIDIHSSPVPDDIIRHYISLCPKPLLNVLSFDPAK